MANNESSANRKGGLSRRDFLAGMGGVALTGALGTNAGAQERSPLVSVDISDLISRSENVSEEELRVLQRDLADDLVAHDRSPSPNGWMFEYPFGDLRIRAVISSGQKSILVIWVFSDKAALPTESPTDRFRGRVFSYACHPNPSAGLQSEPELHTYTPVILSGRQLEPTRPPGWEARQAKFGPDLMKQDAIIARRLIKGTIESILSRM